MTLIKVAVSYPQKILCAQIRGFPVKKTPGKLLGYLLGVSLLNQLQAMYQLDQAHRWDLHSSTLICKKISGSLFVIELSKCFQALYTLAEVADVNQDKNEQSCMRYLGRLCQNHLLRFFFKVCGVYDHGERHFSIMRTFTVSITGGTVVTTSNNDGKFFVTPLYCTW